MTPAQTMDLSATGAPLDIILDFIAIATKIRSITVQSSMETNTGITLRPENAKNVQFTTVCSVETLEDAKNANLAFSLQDRDSDAKLILSTALTRTT